MAIHFTLCLKVLICGFSATVLLSQLLALLKYKGPIRFMLFYKYFKMQKGKPLSKAQKKSF